MIYTIISLFVWIYLIAAFVMAILVMITNYEKLKKLKWWQLMLFFILQPLLSIKQIRRR
jgi:hypothetical protein